MPETVTCTACGTKLQVAATPGPGKKLRCPKCKEVFMPTPPEEEEEQREEEEERPAAKVRRRRDEEEEEEDDYEDKRPARKSSGRKVSRRRTGPFEFDGTAGTYFVVALVSGILSSITLGLGSPWAFCMVTRWQAEHTLINRRRLRFVGTGGGLFALWIVTCILTAITLGIYGFWGVPKIIRWFTENLEFQDGEE
jgi:phage FluMu protein Com